MGNYGKTALTASFTMPNIDGLLEKVQKAGNDIDAVCEDAVKAALPIVEKDMKAGAAKHEKTGAVVNAIDAKPIERSAWGVWGTVGIDTEKHPEAKHAVYQEYGDGHSPGFPDPFIRPAVDDNKAKIKKIERDILKKGGIPIE